MAPMSSPDESVTRFAQRHRLRAAAALIQIIDDEDASANARVAASQSILAYGGAVKPTATTRLVTPTDVAGMSVEQRHALWRALLDVEDSLPAFVTARIADAVSRAAQQLTAAKPNRFTRGPVAGPLPAHVPPPREFKADGAPKPPTDAPHRQPPPPPSPEPSPPLPPAAKGNGNGNANGFGASLLLDDDEPDVRVVEVP
jgi:hypothetical protein